MTGAAPTVVLRSATLSGGSVVAGLRLLGDVVADVRVRPEGVAAVDPPGTLGPARGDAVHDLAGYVLLPAPAEPHAHLDKALLADRAVNRTGDLEGAVEAMRSLGPLTHADVLGRARRAALLYLGHGVTAIRSHVDVGGAAGLDHLEPLLRLRAELAGTVTLQLVALVAAPVTGRVGADNRAVLREALARGADVAGGAPHLDPDPPAATAVTLAVAADAGVPVDLHTDETLDAGSTGLVDLAHHVLATGFPHPVTASHCVSLGMLPPERATRIADDVARAGVRVVTLPLTNLYLQGRGRDTAVPRGLTALRTLLDAGVVVAAGGDNLRDPFHPLGRADPLETAALLVSAGQLRPEEAWDAVSAAARDVLGLPAVPRFGVVRPGAPAELLAVRGSGLRDAVAAADADRTVVSGGRVVVRTRVNRTYPVDLTMTTDAHVNRVT